MNRIMGGAFRLFRVAGITVYLHYTWFLAIFFFAQSPLVRYSNTAWNYAEAVGLFAIVLMHEFGHALATRSVGGKADTIILWPFGGIAFVNAPRRPLATLWAIAAGPLVNVILVPIFILLHHWAIADSAHIDPNVFGFILAMQQINLVLLLFNILPIFPLDGGQILSSILWLFMSEAKAVRIASGLGMVGAVALAIFFLQQGGGAGSSIYIALIMGFLFITAFRAFKAAGAMGAMRGAPAVHSHCRCPNCQASPPVGLQIQCQQCQSRFDLFGAAGVCPECHARYTMVPVRCGRCQSTHPVGDWLTVATVDADTSASEPGTGNPADISSDPKY